MSMPLGCEVKYADYFSEGDLKGRAYHQQGTDFVRLSYYVMGMSLPEDMSCGARCVPRFCQCVSCLSNTCANRYGRSNRSTAS